MLVVSDATPLNILVRIGHIDLLPTLYGQVVIPPAVQVELSHPSTPPEIGAWLASQPNWLTVRKPLNIDPHLVGGFGEREAISLVLELKADLLLADDAGARKTAQRLNIAVTGTVGILEAAAARGLLKLGDAFTELQRTDFFITPAIIDESLRREDARRPK